MARIEDFSDVRDKELVSKLIKEEINTKWVRDLLLGRKGIGPSGGQSSNTLVDNFGIYVWDNLTEEQQQKVIEALNLIIEEDLFKEKAWEDNYCFHVLDFAIALYKKLPEKINIKPFILWKENDFPNLSPPDDPDRPLARRLREQIENAFLKK